MGGGGHTRSRNGLRALARALAFLLVTSPVAAQVQTGSILVRVADERGGIVPGAGVTITSPALVAGKMEGVTDAGGAYRFPSLPPGSYSVAIEMRGFQGLVRKDLVVSVGQTRPLALTLRVARVEEAVTVTATAPVVDTTSANMSVTLDEPLLQRTPGGRDIWSLVEYKVPGLVTSRPDVGGAAGGLPSGGGQQAGAGQGGGQGAGAGPQAGGGLQAAGGLQASMVARGTPNPQNVQFLNGINVGDPTAIGFAGFYYDYDAFDQVQVSTGAHDLSVPSAGVFLNMVTRSGGDRWSGRVSGFWQGDDTQGRNVDERLKAFGFRDEDGAVRFLSDAGFQIGGPIVKDRLRLFSSFRDWRLHFTVPGFAEVEETNVTSGLANLTWQVGEHNRITAYASRQYYRKPNRDASALHTPESVSNEDDRFTLAQALWNSILGQRAFLDARVSYLEMLPSLYLKGDDQSLFDQSTGRLERAAAQEQVFTRRRFQASANLQYFVARALGGRHELRFGLDHSHSPTRTAVRRVDDLTLAWRSANRSASTVQLFNSPLASKATVDVTALFVQDSYSVDRMTITAGARLERVEGYLPEQSSPSSRWFPAATRRFAAVRDVPNWKTIAPRLGLAYDLDGEGKTVVKAALGRYYYTIGTGTPNSVNPNFNSSETYAWNDLDRDLRFDAGERGAFLSRAGGLVTSFGPEVKRPYTDEVVLGVDRELFPGLALSLAVMARRERDNLGSTDVGVPFSAYTIVTRRDNGRDGVSGTADDATTTVWDQRRDTLGQNRFVIANDERLDRSYKGLEVTAVRRFHGRWQMLAGYTLARASVKAAAPNVTTPNALIHAEGPSDLDRTHVFKLSGGGRFPGGIDVSANFRTQTGAPVTRTVTFALTQGNVTVNAEPRGSVRLDPLTTLDARVARTFKVSGRELEASVDGYNLLNANTAWDVRSLTGRISAREAGLPTGAVITQPQFLSPLSILSPRIFRLGLALRF